MRSPLDDRIRNPWSPRGRFTSLVGAVVLVMSVASFAIPHEAVAAAPASSAVTVSGTKGPMGDFSNLRVTVSQTTDLINQSVSISWAGGAPSTVVQGGAWSDFLQIMECWSPNSVTLPDRTQCQFGVGEQLNGAGSAAPINAAGIDGRGVDPPQALGGTAAPYDPMETYTPTSADVHNNLPFAYVPFQSVNGKVIDGSASQTANEFFNVQTTNEIPYGITRPDGTGQEYMQVQNAVEAPGLGCGTTIPVGTTTVKPACWIVVVPRGSTEVDGTSVASKATPDLLSSPLSATNWQQKIAIPLTFQPISGACPINVVEQRTAGSEMVNEAITNWQPGLCTATRNVYSYAQTPDGLARNQLASTTPNAVFLSRPIPPGQAPGNEPPVYAPVSLSGVSIAFNVQIVPGNSASAAVKAQVGARIAHMTLNARLVAKLLTESYKQGAAPKDPATENNPFSMAQDPEFLQLNPDFAQYDDDLGNLIVPESDSDAAWQLWSWIESDPDARAFLDGTTPQHPDPAKMVVNPAFKNIQTGSLATYPKSDSYCLPAGWTTFDDLPAPPLCTASEFAYANDMHDAAHAVATGNPEEVDGLNSVGTGANVTTVLTAAPRAPDGSIQEMTITDTATASRWGLPTASLINASGNAVAPTTCSGASACTTNDAGLLAATQQMTPSGVPGVSVSNPQVTGSAYPLAMLTYAATAPAALTPAQGKVYADMIRYAVQAGQVSGVAPGDLPTGYTPLPADLVNQSLAAATTIQNDAGKPVAAPPGSPQATSLLTGQVVPPGTTGTGSPESLGAGSGGLGSGGSGSPTSSLSSPYGNSGLPGGAGATTPGVAGAQGTGDKKPLTSQPQNAAANSPTSFTRAFPVGLVRLVLLIVLIVGGSAALVGPSLLGISARLRR